jgi:hypothetical protein
VLVCAGGSAGSKHERRAIALFDQALGVNQPGSEDDSTGRLVLHDEKNPEHVKHLDAFLGRAKYFERTKRLAQAVEDLNQVIVFFPYDHAHMHAHTHAHTFDLSKHSHMDILSRRHSCLSLLCFCD